MQTEDLLFQHEGDCATITFNRPQRHNAMTFEMYAQLEALCDTIDADDTIRITVLRGAGGQAFIAGTDIAQFQAFHTAEQAIAYENRIERIVSRLERLRSTTVGMLEGVCAGGGVAIALACDFRYSDENLRLGVPISKTLGNCLSISNVARLVDYIGIARTKEMLMLGRFFNTQECLAMGLVSDVFDEGTIDASLAEKVAALRKLAPLTLSATKVGIRRTLEARRAPAEFGDDFVRECYTSDDFHGAVAAFLDKRRYHWQGK